MSRGRRTHDHEIIKNRDFDREVFCRLETELFHVKATDMPGMVARAIAPSIVLRFIVLPCADEVCSSALPDEVDQICRMV